MITGSSNSQDSFPAPGSSGTSMDGYGYGYPPGSTPDYSSPPMQRPASQTNAPSPHPGKSGGFEFLVTYLVLEHICGVKALLQMPWPGVNKVACG